MNDKELREVELRLWEVGRVDRPQKTTKRNFIKKNKGHFLIAAGFLLFGILFTLLYVQPQHKYVKINAEVIKIENSHTSSQGANRVDKLVTVKYDYKGNTYEAQVLRGWEFNSAKTKIRFQERNPAKLRVTYYYIWLSIGIFCFVMGTAMVVWVVVTFMKKTIFYEKCLQKYEKLLRLNSDEFEIWSKRQKNKYKVITILVSGGFISFIVLCIIGGIVG